jgi:hypothetical protein
MIATDVAVAHLEQSLPLDDYLWMLNLKNKKWHQS